jgi:hypothetical protein
VISSLYRIIKTALSRCAVFVVIALLALAAHGVWLFLQETSHPETLREQRLGELIAARSQAEKSGAEIDRRLGELREALAAQRDRHERAGRIAESLKSLQSFWRRWFGDREQQVANARQIAHLREVQKETRTQITELERAVRLAVRERSQVDLLLGNVDRDIVALQQQRSALVHYALWVWDRDRWWVAAGAVLYFLGGFMLRALIYFIFAPTVVRGRPLWLMRGEPGAQPEVSGSTRELSVALWPGEILRVKNAYYESCDLAIGKTRAWFMDRRLPLTSLLSGWWRPLELHHRHVGGEARVQLVVPEAFATELALVQIPEGGSFIARPSQVVGVIRDTSSRLLVRRRFRPFHWQSWSTMQFRFFEFVGPCRLVIAGRRPLRAARLTAGETTTRAIRRLPKRATVGFSATLEYQPVRADRFWAYSRGRAALFDSAVAGDGVVLYQEPVPVRRGFGARVAHAANALRRLAGI